MTPNRPIFIGIGGGSCAGKTLLTLRIKRGFAPLTVQVIHQDHFYKPTARLPRYYSASSRRYAPDYNHPDAFQWAELRAACRRARGSDILILEGILALHDPVLRGEMDLKVYVECPRAVRLRRRLARGVPGWTKQRHRLYCEECVEPGHRRFVAPTRRFADTVILSRRTGT